MPIHRMKTYFLEIDLVAEQISALYSFGRSYMYYRKINDASNLIDGPRKSFWIHTANTHAMMSVVEWCHVLGNDCRSKIHWHNTAPRKGISEDGEKICNDNYKSEVRHALRLPYNWSNKELRKYVESVIRFRNKYTAHRDVGNFCPLPHLDKAYIIANAYLSWVINEIPWDSEPQQTLLEMQSVFESEVINEINMLSQGSE